MPSLLQIMELNKQGWVLYYSDSCGYCHSVKKKVGPIKWMAMSKIECTKNACPPDVLGYPTWKNKYSGDTWSGGGVFR